MRGGPAYSFSEGGWYASADSAEENEETMGVSPWSFMEPEEKKEGTPADKPFYLGGGKIEVTRGYFGGSKVTRGTDDLPKWIGNDLVTRGEKNLANKIGEREIARNPQTGQIEKIGEEAVDWREEENLRRFLDGK